MRHVYGHGVDEMWAVASNGGHAVTGLSTQAIVYSPCARLTIQKLAVTRDQLTANDPRLTWDAINHVWKETDLASTGELVEDAAVFNGTIGSVEGPGGLKAEINIGGKVVYGFNWDVKTMNAGAGDYRITFSLADDNSSALLNTFITTGTQIVVPVEEEASTEAETGGGVAVIDGADNLSYIDVRIESKTRGNGGGGGNGGGNHQ